MRLAILAAVSLVAASAHAQPGGLSIDLGYFYDRVEANDHTVVPGNLVRFGIRVSLSRHFHVGAEVDDSWLAGTTPVPDGAIARVGGTPMPTMWPLEGTMVAPKALVGAHAIHGPVTWSAELACGVRDTSVSSIWSNDVAGRKEETLLEGHTKIDYWLTSGLTVGAVASADLLVPNDVAFGMSVAVHFAPYDYAR
jgi:hypothetical protein